MTGPISLPVILIILILYPSDQYHSDHIDCMPSVLGSQQWKQVVSGDRVEQVLSGDVDAALRRSAYNTIDLASLFSTAAAADLA